MMVLSLDAFGSKPGKLHLMSLQLTPQQLGSFETLNITTDITLRNATLYDWSARNPIPFHEAWKLQQSIAEQHFHRIKAGTDQFQMEYGDTVLMLQHEPIYTLGTGSDPAFVLSGGVDVIRMDRGGEVTYHGPGQLVVYPILDLRGYHQDIHWYMRALEEAILIALHNVGLHQAKRQEQVTGVWIGNSKVAAIGIKVRRWITMHGLAVNVEHSSLANFQGIVPCGLEGRNVTCINDWLDQPLTTAEFAEYMKESMEKIFCIKLLPKEL